MVRILFHKVNSDGYFRTQRTINHINRLSEQQDGPGGSTYPSE